jgi:hypothetical protein
MTINFTTKTILCLLVFLWIVFSVVYIINDVWSAYKNVQIVGAYEQGRIDTVNVLIKEAEKCEPVPVSSGEKEVLLMNLGCLESEE